MNRHSLAVKRTTRLVAALAVLLLVLASACASQTATRGAGASLTSQAKQPTTEGANPQPSTTNLDSLIRQVVKNGADPSVIRSADISSVQGSADPELDIVITATTKAPEDVMLAEWEALTVGGAIASKLRSAEPPIVLSAIQVEAAMPAGSPFDGQSIHVPSSPLPDASSPLTAQQFETQLRSDLSSAHLSVDSIRFLSPLRSSAVVMLTLPENVSADFSIFSKLDESIYALVSPGGDTCAMDGVYLEVRDASNTPIVISDSVCRLATGASWNSSQSPIQIPHASTPPSTGPTISSLMAHG